MDKEKMLARVRSAVERGRPDGEVPAPATDEPPRAPRRPASGGVYAAPSPAENVAFFCAQLESSGVGLTRAACADELGDCLESLLPSEAGASVALSDAVIELLPRFDERMARRGVRVVVPPHLRATRGAGNGGSRTPGAGAHYAAAADEYRRALFECGVGVSTADYAVADTGTLVLISGGERHRLVSLIAPVHICLLAADRILPDMACLLERALEECYSGASPPHATTLISGPSRTADIEQTLTTGVHGPHELHVLLYEPAAARARLPALGPAATAR